MQEQGNEYVKKGKKHYADALDSYTRAINQKSLDLVHNSVCFANRAQVHLLLGNNRRAYDDAQEAVKLNEANIKVFYKPSELLECQIATIKFAILFTN